MIRHSFSCRTSLVGATLAIWFCGLSRPGSGLPGKENQRPGAQSIERVAEEDIRVMRCVLQDFIRRPEVRGRSTPRIIFLNNAPSWDPVQLARDSRESGHWTNALPTASPQLQSNLRRRNGVPKYEQPNRHAWVGLRLPSLQISEAEFDIRRPEGRKEFLQRYPSASGFVSAWLPGYSDDGTTAIVEFVGGPSPELLGVYVLTKAKGQWIIRRSYAGPPIL